jgi:hypothetical protein
MLDKLGRRDNGHPRFDVPVRGFVFFAEQAHINLRVFFVSGEHKAQERPRRVRRRVALRGVEPVYDAGIVVRRYDDVNRHEIAVAELVVFRQAA